MQKIHAVMQEELITLVEGRDLFEKSMRSAPRAVHAVAHTEFRLIVRRNGMNVDVNVKL